MTSRVLTINAIRTRVVNQLYVSKTPYVDPANPDQTQNRKFKYSWKPDRAEMIRIKRLSKGYVQPIITED